MTATSEFDAIVVGAGFAGLYMLHRLREMNLKVVLVEAGDDVGGTWYWNRYPGCRCDVESTQYQFGFSETVARGWTWKERYATQAEIHAYLRYVADTLDLRGDIRLNTRVDRAAFDEERSIWAVETDRGDRLQARFCIMATGCLSAANLPNIPGLDDFGGKWFHTGNWPHEPVDFTGKHVAVIGTGSSGVQVIPEIAKQAEHLTVFQRTPSFILPAGNRPLDAGAAREAQASVVADRQRARRTPTGLIGIARNDKSVLDVSEEERQREFADRWVMGGFAFLSSYNDLFRSEAANDHAAQFARAQMRARISDPEVAETAVPTSYPAGTKRPCLDTGYLETLCAPNVTLVDTRTAPVERITAKGIVRGGEEYAVDSIVFATGFDALTGALTRIDIIGRDGVVLRNHWEAGARTYLGIASAGFPNMFFIAGPGSPSVISNVPVSIEMHVEWVADTIATMMERHLDTIEAAPEAEAAWVEHVNALAEATLYPRTATWYMGANIPGKPRVFMPYLGGVSTYGKRLAEVADQNYSGFVLGSVDAPLTQSAG